MFVFMATLYRVLSGSHRATVKGVRTNVPKGKTFIGPDGLEKRFPNKLKAIKTAPDAPTATKEPVETTEDKTPEVKKSKPAKNEDKTPEATETKLEPTPEEQHPELVEDSPEPTEAASLEELEAEVDEPEVKTNGEDADEDLETEEETDAFDYETSKHIGELRAMTVAQLKAYAEESEFDTTGASVKEDYVRTIATNLGE